MTKSPPTVESAQRHRIQQEADGRRNVERYLANVSAVAARTGNVERRKAKTSTERSHAFRARARELGEIKECANKERRGKCAASLLEFGKTYCMGPDKMLHYPPSERMMPFVDALQKTITSGGNRHVRWPRGKGKSTWVKIAALWALSYGYRRFVVIIAATKPMAEESTAEIWRFASEDPTYAEDFPEIAAPLVDVSLTPQRMRVQTYRGRKTHMADNTRFAYKRFASIQGYANTGGIIAARGADQAIRGLNIGSRRPDFIFIDDPQTDQDAQSPRACDKIENRIQGALLGLGETKRIIAAVMASTAIEPGDVSERFADRERHPEWITETTPFVISWGPESVRSRYLAELKADNAHGDVSLTRSRRFYREHQAEIERGTIVMDPTDFDPNMEMSAYQHALNLLHMMKAKNFNAEYQMKPTRAQGLYSISAQIVASRVNGYPYGEVPPECNQGIVAFCDVNAVAGLRWEIVAFGRGRIAATLAYGKYPQHGRLFPEGTAESAIPAYLAPALRTVAESVANATFNRGGTAAKVDALCFDGGWQTETVALVAQSLDGSGGMHVGWSMGYSAKLYSRYHHDKAKTTKGLRAAEQCHTWPTANGVYLAFNADYWREVSQTSFLVAPLKPSSSSLWGKDPADHFDFASEVCGETLAGKEDHPRYGTVWTWKKNGENHFGDCHYGCLALGAIRGNFDAVERLESVGAIQAAAKLRRARRKFIRKA